MCHAIRNDNALQGGTVAECILPYLGDSFGNDHVAYTAHVVDSIRIT